MAASPASAQTPSAEEILNQARIAHTSQTAELTGHLRTGSVKHPFQLTVQPGVVEFRFQNKPLVVRLALAEGGSTLSVSEGGKMRTLTGEALAEKVLDTDITYEDLSLRFLYWPDAKVEGEETISTRKTWKIRLMTPTRKALYAGVFVWVDQESGGLVQMEGYDWDGKHVKRFRVTSVQKIAGKMMLKSMRVESFVPGTRKVTSRSYIDITGGN
jgi:hypothetical protein